MEHSEQNNVRAIADLVEGYHQPQIVDIEGRGALERAGVLVVPQNMTVHQIDGFLDSLRMQPRRRRGTITAHDLTSLIALCDRFKDGDSVVFADANAQQMVAVFNYNRAGSDGSEAGQPRFGDHRALYKFPLSKEWKAWAEKNGVMMQQLDFAAFIEDRIADVIPPDPALSAVPAASSRSSAQQLAQLLGGEFATPNRLLELSRGLAVREGAQVKGFTNLSTGETQIQFDTTHTDADGRPLNVPSLFLLAIPVYDNGPLWKVAARLRYRLGGGRVNWFYQLYRPELILEQAFEEACATVAEQTGLPVYRGVADGRSE